MTAEVFAATMAVPEEDDVFDAMAPENVSPLVAWLVSPESAGISGRIFEIEGGRVSIADGWQHGPGRAREGRWPATDLGPVIHQLLQEAPAPAPVYGTAK